MVWNYSENYNHKLLVKYKEIKQKIIDLEKEMGFSRND